LTLYARLVYLSFSFLSFHNISLLTSIGQTDEPISMVESSNDAFTPNGVPFWGPIEKIPAYGVNNPKNRQLKGVVYGFPATLGKSTKTRNSVKSRDRPIDTKLELWVETKGYFGSNVTYHLIKDGDSHHFEKKLNL
jgi:hypothetical protein